MMCADFFDFYEKVNRPPASSEKRAGRTPPPSEPLTVSQLTALIGEALGSCLPPTLHVKGEVSNFKHHGGSGHLYFTLKDAETCIDCVMFRSDSGRLRFTPEDGIEVLATGRVSVYGQRGRYQLYVSRLEPLGAGALELAFRQLCAKLEAEGLFAPERKKQLPAYPQRIAIVTSTQTAALQDMLKVLRRFPWVRLMVYHVPVQGEGSAERIAGAIGDLNRHAKRLGGIDLILLGRGGGSLEDLWEFNEEIVARAVVASRIPIITGIGHEIDVSVADLVADHHAHTPTEAAQVAMDRWRTAGDALDQLGVRLRRELRTIVTAARQRLGEIERHGIFRRPMERINVARQVLDDRQRVLQLMLLGQLREARTRLGEMAMRLERHRPGAMVMRLRERLALDQQNLVRAATARLRMQRERVNRLEASLRERHPRHRIQLERQRVEGMSRRLARAMGQLCTAQQRRVAALGAHLRAVGPQQVLARGFSYTVMRKTGAVVRSAGALRPGDRLVTHFAEGSVESTVDDTRQMKLFE